MRSGHIVRSDTAASPSSAGLSALNLPGGDGRTRAQPGLGKLLRQPLSRRLCLHGRVVDALLPLRLEGSNGPIFGAERGAVLAAGASRFSLLLDGLLVFKIRPSLFCVLFARSECGAVRFSADRRD